MKFLKNFFKRIFRRPAVILVTLWARLIYNYGVRMADEAHKRSRNMTFLAADNFRPGMLTVYDKHRFKLEKKVYGYHARLLTMVTLKNGCYYHTCDRFGKNGMSEKDKDIRRRYFIMERLELAKLL